MSPEAYVSPGATLVGDVTLAAECGVFAGAVLRAEAASVTLGTQANVQDNCVVEATPGHPVTIGERVTLGHNARVYGATIDDRAMVAIQCQIRRPAAMVGAP